MEYLQDLSFLKQICSLQAQETAARIILLNFDETPQEEITGTVIDGTINLDGASAMQRTCSLSLIVNKLTFPQINWILESKIKIEIGLKNTTNLYTNYDIIWFPMGIYYLTNLSISESTVAYTLSLQGKDKMCQLTGDIGGVFNSTIDFGTIDIVDKKNEIITKQLKISSIIKELVHTYGNELYHKIFLYDLEDYAIKLMSYYGETPLYVLLNASENNQFSIINYVKDENYIIYDINGKEVKLKEILEENLFISQYNILKQENQCTIFYLDSEKTSSIYIKKCNYGDIIGYVLTDLVYGDELIAGPGETVKSILDKIKNKLGIYEYFYDVNGNFIFKKQDQYAQINSYLNPYVSYLAPTYSFIDNELKINNNYTYNLSDIKNDFTVWGERTGINSNSKTDIHMRVAIDQKPKKYVSINIDDKKANYLIKSYQEFYPLLPNETVEEQLERIKQKPICYIASTEEYKEELCLDANIDYDIIKYVDWREIIYQMAQDYKKYNYVDQFASWVQEVNPECSYGKTGYERYYTDIDGFWRTLYQLDFEPVDNQEVLSSTYNYRIKGEPKIIKNRSGLKIYRNSQLLKSKYPNGYSIEWKTIDNNSDYEFLLMLYNYIDEEFSGNQELYYFNDDNKQIKLTGSQISRQLSRTEAEYDFDEEIFQNNRKYILRNLKTNATKNYTLKEINNLKQWNDRELDKNHLIIWALCYKLLYNTNGELIESFSQLEDDKTYNIFPLFLSNDLELQSNDSEIIENIEQDLQEQQLQEIHKKGFQFFIITKQHTFRILSQQENNNIIFDKNYNTQLKEKDYPVYNKIINKETGEEEFQYIGTCQNVINNNYNILKKLYWFAANGDDTKDYLMCKHLNTGVIEPQINSTELIRLLNFDFQEVPDRFEYFHNTSWLQFIYKQNTTDYTFDDAQTIYYDLTHLYKSYNNTTLISTQENDVEKIDSQNQTYYIPINSYPQNKEGSDLTNLKDFSKDENSLLLWAQAYNILYKQNKDIDIKTHYNKNIIKNPADLIFWFDFLDDNTFSVQYSINNIGPRELIKKDPSVSVIEYLQYLDNIFLDYNEDVSKDEQVIQKFFKSTFALSRPNMQVFRLGELDNHLLTLTERGRSAAEVINNYIYEHIYITQGVSISAIPQYFLTPNSLINMINTKDQIIDKYIINKITFSLRNGGTMSIQASKMLPEVLERQDVRKEIINE